MKLLQLFSVLMIKAILDKVSAGAGQKPLNCSEFGVNASSVSEALQNWEARLLACFDAHPYDKRQLPASPDALPIGLSYDWALVSLLSFQEGFLKVSVYNFFSTYNNCTVYFGT